MGRFLQMRPAMEATPHSQRVRGMVYASLFAALLSGSALFSFPLGPVPITLQVLFVLLAGGLLGPRWGALSMILYLLTGLMGLPVFSGGRSGPGHLLGPTGGYLAGFPLCAFLVGTVLSRRRSTPFLVLAMAMGLASIYVPGILWLALSSRLPLGKALALGMVPFLPADLIKAAVAAWVLKGRGPLFR